MSARIFCKVGELQGLAAEVGAEATLGRSRQATIPLQANLVSGEHARLRYEPDQGCYVLEDLGSTNGTELDGMKVRGRERLGHLHVITLAGTYDLIFQDLELSARRHGGTHAAPMPAKATPASEEPPSEDTEVDGLPLKLPSVIAETDDAMERTTVEPAAIGLPDILAARADEARTGEAPVFGLEVHHPDGTVLKPLAEGENLVGRVESAALKLDMLDVSRRHAVLTVAGGEVTVRDLGSSNHTFVEGVETEGTVAVPLGAKLGFGSLEARLIPWEGEEP